MIIPLINPRPSRRLIARKVARHLRKDIAHYRHEIKEHGRLIRGLRRINPNRAPKKWWDRMMKEQRKHYSVEASRKVIGSIWSGLSSSKRSEILHRYEHNPSPAFRRRGRSAQRRLAALTSLKESRMVYKMRPRRKRRATRRRHNPRFGFHRPTLLFSRDGWRRPRRSRLFRHSARVNPRHRKYSRRHVRHNDPRRMRSFSFLRNPALPFAIDKVAIGGVKIAGGIAIGMLGMPVLVKFIPSTMYKYRNFYGIVHVIVGAVAAGAIRNQMVKEIALIVAGTGVYDLIASNLSFLGLPALPNSNALIGTAAAPAAPAAPAVTSGENYAPAMVGTSYGSSYMGEQIAYGDSDVEIE